MTVSHPPRTHVAQHAFPLTRGEVLARLNAAMRGPGDVGVAVHELLEHRPDVIGFIARSGDAPLVVAGCRAALCLDDPDEQTDVCTALLTPEALGSLAAHLDAAALSWVADEPLQCLPGHDFISAMGVLATPDATARVMRTGRPGDMARWVNAASHLPSEHRLAVLNELVSTDQALERVAGCERPGFIGTVAMSLAALPEPSRETAMARLFTDQALATLVEEGGSPASTIQAAWALSNLPPGLAQPLLRRLLTPAVLAEVQQDGTASQVGNVVALGTLLPPGDFRAVLGELFASPRTMDAVAASGDASAICQTVVGALRLHDEPRRAALEHLLSEGAVDTLLQAGQVSHVGWAAEASMYLPIDQREQATVRLLRPRSVRETLASPDLLARAQVTLALTHLPPELQWGLLPHCWTRDAVRAMAAATDPHVIGLMALSASRLPGGQREMVMAQLLPDASIEAVATRGSARSMGQVAFALAHAQSVLRAPGLEKLLTPDVLQTVAQANDPEAVARTVVGIRCLQVPQACDAALRQLLTPEVLADVAAHGGALSIVQVAQGIEALLDGSQRAACGAALLTDHAIDKVLAAGHADQAATLASAATALDSPCREDALARLLGDRTLIELESSGSAAALARAANGAARLPPERCAQALPQLLTDDTAGRVEASQHAPAIASVAEVSALLPAELRASFAGRLFTPRAVALVVASGDPVLAAQMQTGIAALPQPLQGQMADLLRLESALAEPDPAWRDRAVQAVLQTEGLAPRIAASGHPELIARACDAAQGLRDPAARHRACGDLLTDAVVDLAGVSVDPGFVSRIVRAAVGLLPGQRETVMVDVLSPRNLELVAASGDPVAKDRVTRGMEGLPQPWRDEARALFSLASAMAETLPEMREQAVRDALQAPGVAACVAASSHPALIRMVGEATSVLGPDATPAGAALPTLHFRQLLGGGAGTAPRGPAAVSGPQL